MSYGCQKLDRSTESEMWTYYTFQYRSGIWRNFAMTSPEILRTKHVINELKFLLVTHMANSDARFDSCGILKLGPGAELVLGRLGRWMNDQVLLA
jgi:hypothetical protein